MKIAVISDTHGLHHGLKLEPADMIIHAGDVTGNGSRRQVLSFLEWFRNLDIEYKVMIAGNHDFFFEQSSTLEIMEMLDYEVIYLNDSGIRINGIYIWGSPIQPAFNNWAFNRERGIAIKKHWDLIPEKTDILITHGPPYGILDKTISGERTGCSDLQARIKKVKPWYHIFGHIHESYGICKKKHTTFINASILDRKYNINNKPVYINYNNTHQNKNSKY